MGLHKPTNILKTEVDTLILAVTQLAIWQALSGKASPDSAWEPLCSLGLRIQDSLCLEHPSPSLGLTPIGLSGPFAASPGKTSWISTPIWVIVSATVSRIRMSAPQGQDMPYSLLCPQNLAQGQAQSRGSLNIC